MRKSRSVSKKTPSRKPHRIVKYLRGSATISLMVIVIIIGSVVLAGGILPKTPGSPGYGGDGQGQEGVIDETSLNQDQGRNNLQLQTIKFKPCAETITMNLLLDRSDSMGRTTPSGVKKLERLKEAVNALSANLNDNSIIGIQSFNSNSITSDVTIDYFRNNKAQATAAVAALNHSGSTPTHNALAFTYQRLAEAIPQFPGRQFNFVFISDGEPVPAEQDPYLFNPNPVDQIKALGVNVYALGIYDSGQTSNPALAALLGKIASTPENYFVAATADDTTRLLTSITEKICDSQPTPAP